MNFNDILDEERKIQSKKELHSISCALDAVIKSAEQATSFEEFVSFLKQFKEVVDNKRDAI